MSEDFRGVQIYAVFPARDIRVWLERHAGARTGREVDVEASLAACEAAIERTLQETYAGARILVRRQDHPTPEPPRTRVESTATGVDTGELEQEVLDLISEFDVGSCVVYRAD